MSDVLLLLAIFKTKQKSPRKILGWLLLTAEILQEVMYLTSTWAKSCIKFNPKMQDFERVSDVNCK